MTDWSVPSVKSYTWSPELFGHTYKVMNLCVCTSVHFFFSGEEIHSFLICKRFDDTPKEKKELLPWNVFNATLGTRDLHRSCDECQIPLYFLKIPLENIFWLIVLSFSFCFSFCFSRWCFCLLSPYCNKALIKYLSAVGDLSSILRNIMCKVQILLSRITVLQQFYFKLFL